MNPKQLRTSLSSAAALVTFLGGAFVLHGSVWAQEQPGPAPAARTAGSVPAVVASPAPTPAIVPGTGASTGPQLHNLTLQGNTLQAGDAACPNQPYYLYSGGKHDNYAAPADRAYPSPNLVAFIPPPAGSTVAYDTAMVNQRFGDSFNLQNTRGVCYAIVQFATRSTNGGSNNDGLTMGHVGPNGTPFTTVAQVINPGAVTGMQSYALTQTGLNQLSQQTGWGLDKTPAQSVFDLYLQDDTMIDFFRLFVWYGPNCSQIGGGNGGSNSGC